MAVIRGKLVKKPCSVCGCSNAEMHHPDYSKPLEVVWLCKKHHLELHVQTNMPRKSNHLCRCGKVKKPGRKKCDECTAAYMRKWRAGKVLVPYDLLCPVCKENLFESVTPRSQGSSQTN